MCMTAIIETYLRVPSLNNPMHKASVHLGVLSEFSWFISLLGYSFFRFQIKCYFLRKAFDNPQGHFRPGVYPSYILS